MNFFTRVYSRNHFLKGGFTFQWGGGGAFQIGGASFLSGEGFIFDEVGARGVRKKSRLPRSILGNPDDSRENLKQQVTQTCLMFSDFQALDCIVKLNKFLLSATSRVD